jgi:hypothetical protein
MNYLEIAKNYWKKMQLDNPKTVRFDIFRHGRLPRCRGAWSYKGESPGERLAPPPAAPNRLKLNFHQIVPQHDMWKNCTAGVQFERVVPFRQGVHMHQDEAADARFAGQLCHGTSHAVTR